MKVAVAVASSSRRRHGRARWPTSRTPAAVAERSVADVSAVGNPNTGVDVYDSTPEGTGQPTGWTVFGGTSVASPIIAAEFALAGGAHGVDFPAATLYAHLGEGDDLYDVLTGSNGSCGEATSCQAAVGYDGPTGVGSPVGLGAFATAGSPENTSPPTIAGIAEQGQTLTLTAGSWTNSPTSSSDQWQRCNASGTGCVAIEGATGQSYKLGASDVGATIRVQETAANADGTGRSGRLRGDGRGRVGHPEARPLHAELGDHGQRRDDRRQRVWAG
jgi:hypothetical protein